MNTIPKDLKPVKYRVYEEFQMGYEPGYREDAMLAGIPNIFHLYVTFDNNEEYKIVDYGFNLEPIPTCFRPYKENRDKYNQMSKNQVMQLLKIIFNSDNIEKINLHTFNCLEKMVEISNLNDDKDVINMLISIDLKSRKELEKKRGVKEAQQTIELQEAIDHLEKLSTTTPLEVIEDNINSMIEEEKKQDILNSSDKIIPFKRK